MDKITPIKLEQTFLELHTYEIQFILLFGGILLLLLIEGFIPRRKINKDQTSRWLSNLSITIFNHFFILFYSILIVSFTNKIIQQNVTLFHAFHVSDLSKFIIVLLIMEFITYWIHRFFHKYPLLWRIHAVHHTDTDVDVTTSHRHHPFEPMINALIVIPVVFALGASSSIIIIYNITYLFFSLVTHSNIFLPEKLDKILRLFVITPDFHRMHHSSNKKYTDSNYGAILPWFDYLFKTATKVSFNENAKMELGLETMRKPEDNRLDKMLLTPFKLKS